MTENIKKILEILGVEPGEIFRIPGLGGKNDRFRFDEDFNLHMVGKDGLSCEVSEVYIIKLITGKLRIEKIIPWTDEERLCAEYAKLCGCKYIVKDGDGQITAARGKPVKYGESLWSVMSDAEEGLGGFRILADMPHIGTDRMYSVDEICN